MTDILIFNGPAYNHYLVNIRKAQKKTKLPIAFSDNEHSAAMGEAVAL
jgi:hypothetical protein